MPAPTFDSLIRWEKKDSIDLTRVEKMLLGENLPVQWRANVTLPWTNCVLQRTSKVDFIIFDRDGGEKLETIEYGFNDDGSPVDGGITTEWEMTIQGDYAHTRCSLSQCTCSQQYHYIVRTIHQNIMLWEAMHEMLSLQNDANTVA